MKLKLDFYANCYSDAKALFDSSIQNLGVSVVDFSSIEIHGDGMKDRSYRYFKFEFTAEVTPVH